MHVRCAFISTTQQLREAALRTSILGRFNLTWCVLQMSLGYSDTPIYSMRYIQCRFLPGWAQLHSKINFVYVPHMNTTIGVHVLCATLLSIISTWAYYN
jgi:hypothetical protein